jgi:hypothetical protein
VYGKVADSRLSRAVSARLRDRKGMYLSSCTSHRVNNLDPRGMIWTPYPRYNSPSPSSAPLLHQSKTSNPCATSNVEMGESQTPTRNSFAILSPIRNFADRHEHLNFKRKTSPSEKPSMHSTDPQTSSRSQFVMDTYSSASKIT